MAQTPPVSEDFNTMTEDGPISQSSPTVNIDASDPTLYGLGSWDSDYPNTDGAAPSSGGMAAKGVMGVYNSQQVTLAGFGWDLDPSDGVTLSYHIYIPSDYDATRTMDYWTGTGDVTQNETTVENLSPALSSAEQTAFGQAGAHFQGPTGQLYDVAAVVNSTTITLSSPYVPTSATGASVKLLRWDPGILYIKTMCFGDGTDDDRYAAFGPHNCYDLTWWFDLFPPHTTPGIQLRYTGTVSPVPLKLTEWISVPGAVPNFRDYTDQWFKIKHYVKYGDYPLWLGTGDVTNNSTTVDNLSAVLTSEQITNAPGENFVGPDGEIYVVDTVTDNNTIELTTPYSGSTDTGVDCTIGGWNGIVRMWIDTGEGEVLVGETTTFPLFQVSTGCDGLMHWARCNYHMNPHTEPPYPTGAQYWIDDISITRDGGAGSPPQLSVCRPRSGPISGYNDVILQGSNFTQSNVTSVTFNGVESTEFSVDSTTQVTARVPAGRGEVTVDVAVSGAAGTSEVVDAYTYVDSGCGRLVDPFTATPIGSNWTEVDNADGELYHYDATTWCLRDSAPDYTPESGDNAAAFFTGSYDTDHRIVLRGVREGTGWAEILVLLQASGATWGGFNTLAFRWYTLAGNSYTLLNWAYIEDGTLWSSAVGLSTTDSAYIIPATFQIEFEVKTGGTYYARVLNPALDDPLIWSGSHGNMPGGYSGAPGFAFLGSNNWNNNSYGIRADSAIIIDSTSVDTPPIVSTVLPSSGPPAGGTPVTITGSGFLASPQVHFGTESDWNLAGSIVRVDANTITCTSPAQGDDAIANVRVTNTDGLWDYIAAGYTFTFLSAVDVTSCTANVGPTVGGTAVTVEGTGFQSGCQVYFGALEATNVVFVDSTEVTCVTPAHSAGAVDVKIVNPDAGEDALSGGFTYGVQPTISSCTPNSGIRTGGTEVVIAGVGFTDTTAVTFGNVAASSFDVDSDTQITATTALYPYKSNPQGTQVDVVVTDTYGSDTLVNGFTFFETAAEDDVSLEATGILRLPSNIAVTTQSPLPSNPATSTLSDELAMGGTKPGKKIRVEGRFGRKFTRRRKK